MAKKASNPEDKKDPKSSRTTPKIEVKPSYLSYIKAVWVLVLAWVKNHKLRTVIISLVAILVAAGLVVITRPDPAKMTNDEVVIRVSRELSISGDSNPAILTVEDETKVSQPFLDEAKNGDKVLLYYKSNKSVLFRPSENRIVRTGTFTPPDAKVFIRQGTNDAAKLETAKEQIGKLTDVEIVSKDYSTNRLNDKTVVVDITDRYPGSLQEIAKTLNADIVRLPDGETIPDADILVIIGSQ